MKIILLITYVFVLNIQAQNFNRYTDSLFTYEKVVSDKIYATALALDSNYNGESSTYLQELKFDLYQPKDDSLEIRPLLICVHGGAFIEGTKENEDMVEFCKVFAQRGYVTTTIQYRIGMNLLSPNSSERAVYRGIQDGRAAVRYFKENATEYGIDTNNIYILGSSAGAFVGLHNLFMNEEGERPKSSFEISNSLQTSDNGPDLGSLDAVNPNIDHNSHPKGVIALWGAIRDTLLIKETDVSVPLFLVHGKADNSVHFGIGSPFNFFLFPKTFGSSVIDRRLQNLGVFSETYFVDGKKHEFYGVSKGMWNPEPNLYWDTIVTKSSNFMWNIHKPIANFASGYDTTTDSIVFEDSSKGAIKWEWDFGDGDFSNEQNPTHHYSEWNRYLVKLKIFNSIDSWDTTSAYIDFIHVDVEDEKILPLNFELSQNYPNPFNPTTVIKYQIPNNKSQTNFNVALGNESFRSVQLIIYDLLGRVVATLVNEKKSAGKYSVSFDASNLNSGVYFYSLSVGNFKETKKMILLR
ncbi:MAG: carboxylesterase family protein [Melioribacteraceae bacterium]